MYESFFGFKEKPFNTLPDPEFLYMSTKHEMALTYLEYGLSSHAGFMVLTGEIGSGKTTLINHLINKIERASAKTALIFNTNVTPLGFLESILKEWGVVCTKRRKTDLQEALNEFLLGEYKNRTNVLLIIDEAQNLGFETLEEIRMISNLNDDKVPLLQIILSGQPNLINRLNHPRLEQLRQRIAIHYHLDALSAEETQRYIQHRLTKVQAFNPDIFTHEAAESIHTASGGVPRVINLICDLALVYGYAEQKKVLDKTIIDLVVADRQKMGLEFGRARPSPAVEEKRKQAGLHKIASLEKKHQELHDNVYELALMVKKIIQAAKNEKAYLQELKTLQARLDTLEECLSAAGYETKYTTLRGN